MAGNNSSCHTPGQAYLRYELLLEQPHLHIVRLRFDAPCLCSADANATHVIASIMAAAILTVELVFSHQALVYYGLVRTLPM
jgi:hypothetical protein